MGEVLGRHDERSDAALQVLANCGLTDNTVSRSHLVFEADGRLVAHGYTRRRRRGAEVSVELGCPVDVEPGDVLILGAALALLVAPA